MSEGESATSIDAPAGGSSGTTTAAPGPAAPAGTRATGPAPGVTATEIRIGFQPALDVEQAQDPGGILRNRSQRNGTHAGMAVLDRWVLALLSGGVVMSTLTIRQLDARTHARLRGRAAEHGRSVEAEVRAILDAAVNLPAHNFLLSLHAAVAEVGGVDLDVPSRTDQPRPVDLS